MSVERQGGGAETEEAKRLRLACFGYSRAGSKRVTVEVVDADTHKKLGRKFNVSKEVFFSPGFEEQVLIRFSNRGENNEEQK